MDKIVSSWIIEYLLRQKMKDEAIEDVIISLKVANHGYRVKKTLLLRQIETDVSRGYTENILTLLEMMEALDRENGKTASDLMKEAFCLSAVDATAVLLEENKKNLDKAEKIWKNGVPKFEGFVSDMSRNWRQDIELALKDSIVYEKCRMRNTRNEALRAVEAYLKEAWDDLGPSLLELAAAKAGNEVEGQGLGYGYGYGCGVGVGGGGGDDGDDITPSVTTTPQFVGFHFLGTQSARALIWRKHVSPVGGHQRGTKISNANKAAVNKPSDSVPESTRPQEDTPEVDKVNKVMSSSPKSTPVVGVEHHSGNSHNDQTLSSTGPTCNKNVVEGLIEKGPGNGKQARKQSSPERGLPRSEVQRISPLTTQGYKSRRQIKRWTHVEVETLKEAVSKYGRGNWKMMVLDAKYAAVLEGRTEVDLKDKWRNLTRVRTDPP